MKYFFIVVIIILISSCCVYKRTRDINGVGTITEIGIASINSAQNAVNEGAK